MDNERVIVHQIDGTVANDLHGALQEMQAIASGTECKQHMYSCSINPSQFMSPQQYMAAIDRIGERLGLQDNARAVVFHQKEGRFHAHAVWSRIDPETMKAVQLSFDHMKLRTLSRELGLAFGHNIPHGLKYDKGAERDNRHSNQAEQKQAERTGITVKDRKAAITAIYKDAQSSNDLVTGLEKAGYLLAQGDSRSFVVVDRAGEVHGLARQITGVKTAEVKKALHPLTPEKLPNVQEAKEFWTKGKIPENVVKQNYQTQKRYMLQRHSVERKAQNGEYKTLRASLKDKEASEVSDIKQRITAAFKSDWRQLFKEQEDATRVLKEAGRNVITRLRFLLNSKGMDRFQPEARGTLSGVFNWVVRGKLEGSKLEKKFAKQRRALGQVQRLAERTEIRVIREDYKAQRKELSDQQRSDRDSLQERQAKEIKELERAKENALTPEQVLTGHLPDRATTAHKADKAMTNSESRVAKEMRLMKEQAEREKQSRGLGKGRDR